MKSRIILFMSYCLAVVSCNQEQEPFPEMCRAHVQGFTFDSISGQRLPNMPLFQNIGYQNLSDDTSYLVVSFNSGECDEIYDKGDQIIAQHQDRYFTRQTIESEMLVENDTIDFDIPFIRASVVKLVMLDTSNVSHHCFEYFYYPFDNMRGTLDARLADTTRYIHVYPNRASRIRWYTIEGTISSGQVSVPLSDNSSPWNYTMYGDTLISVGIDDTVQVNCFY